MDNVQSIMYVVSMFHKDSCDHYIYCKSSTIYILSRLWNDVHVCNYLDITSSKYIPFPSQNIATLNSRELVYFYISVI